MRATLARRPRVDWLAPAVAAAATALIFTLAVLPSLPRTGPDPVHRLVRAVVAEHTRAVLWGARRPDVIPAALPWLTQESGIDLRSVFSGDEHLTLLGAEPVYIEQRCGLAVHYRDADGHHLTYTVLPAPGLTLPERRRVPMGRWRPALLREGDFSVASPASSSPTWSPRPTSRASRSTSSGCAAPPSRCRRTDRRVDTSLPADLGFARPRPAGGPRARAWPRGSRAWSEPRRSTCRVRPPS